MDRGEGVVGEVTDAEPLPVLTPYDIEQSLSYVKRRALQALCKEKGLRANGKVYMQLHIHHIRSHDDDNDDCNTEQRFG